MEELRRLRKARGLTQRGLADASGVDPATISLVENGKRRPHLETLDSLAMALGVEVTDLIPKGQPPLFDDLVERSRPIQDERRLLRTWRAFVYRLADRWEANPPTSRQEVAVVLEVMQSLIDEGALERPPGEIPKSEDAADEWFQKMFLFDGIAKLNEMADNVEADEEAEQRRATFREIKTRMALTA